MILYRFLMFFYHILLFFCRFLMVFYSFLMIFYRFLTIFTDFLSFIFFFNRLFSFSYELLSFSDGLRSSYNGDLWWWLLSTLVYIRGEKWRGNIEMYGREGRKWWPRGNSATQSARCCTMSTSIAHWINNPLQRTISHFFTKEMCFLLTYIFF